MKLIIQKIKGVSKVVVKKEIKHSNYSDISPGKETSIKRDVTSIRSVNHQAYTYVQNKEALTGFYDKMKNDKWHR